MAVWARCSPMPVPPGRPEPAGRTACRGNSMPGPLSMISMRIACGKAATVQRDQPRAIRVRSTISPMPLIACTALRTFSTYRISCSRSPISGGRLIVVVALDGQAVWGFRQHQAAHAFEYFADAEFRSAAGDAASAGGRASLAGAGDSSTMTCVYSLSRGSGNSCAKEVARRRGCRQAGS